jgi:TPP-dependent pyruvate/acetoin dehydrogenase alpha subunit
MNVDANAAPEVIAALAADLVAFERDIAAEYDAAKIRAPVHLAGGNEEQLIRIFAEVRPQDWIASTWRSHYHALLKGIPPAELKAAIMAGRSITLCFPEHRFFSSAIVGGALPIALGIAWSIVRARGEENVWAFVGDMAAEGGMFHECVRYAQGHKLPINFVVEGNGKSVCTDTREAWGVGAAVPIPRMVTRYEYDLPWPHAGAGRRINF